MQKIILILIIFIVGSMLVVFQVRKNESIPAGEFDNSEAKQENDTDYVSGLTSVLKDAQEPHQSSNTLDLSNRGLTQVSQDVFKQTDLRGLDVSNNNLTGALPAEIRHLQKLEILNASNNQMTGVPAEVGQLQNLRVLDLSDNQLTGLPYELGNLKNLEVLNLSGNDYSEHDLNIIRQGLPDHVNIVVD